MDVKLLYSNSIAPTRGTEGSAGWDLYCNDDVILQPGERQMVGTGVAIDVGKGNLGLLTHRSSLAKKLGIICSLGIIDSDYRGECMCILFNLGQEPVHIAEGDRFSQVIILPYADPGVLCALAQEDLEDTVRGTGGFGSTGS